MRSSRESARPTVIGLPEGLAMTVAPASTASMPGVCGTHRSSQISIASRKPGTSSAENSRSVPNGASISGDRDLFGPKPRAGAKWRFS